MPSNAQDERSAEEALNFLASMPCGNVSVTTRALRHLMLRTGGWLLSGGRMYDIAPKRLGAGVYRLTLKERA